MTADMLSIIEPLIPAMRRYARALLRDPSAADDLVQDCLERAVGRWRQRRDDGNARSWIFSILHNLAMTRLHRASNHAGTLPIDEVKDLAVPDAQEENLHYQDVLSALSQLPDEHRTLLLLIAVEDLSYAEAAKVLDIPIGTVMSRLSRARERLHKVLAHEPYRNARTSLRRVK